MTPEEIKVKYLGKMVAHHDKPYMFWVESLFRSADKRTIFAGFAHPYYRHIPKGQPQNADIETLEKEYRILG